MEKITLRVYGEADLIRFRSFTKGSWEEVLNISKLNSDTFIKNLFDPDFFLQHDFPHYVEERNAESLEDFFGDTCFSGPLSHQRAIVDMKFVRKKMYRGTLDNFLGNDSLFPLVNLAFHSLTVKEDRETITICCIERTAGQVINAYCICEHFNPEKFIVKVVDLTIGKHVVKLVDSFSYAGFPFKLAKSDSVVRSQYGFLI